MLSDSQIPKPFYVRLHSQWGLSALSVQKLNEPSEMGVLISEICINRLQTIIMRQASKNEDTVTLQVFL